jgi:hypothetical protein
MFKYPIYLDGISGRPAGQVLGRWEKNRRANLQAVEEKIHTLQSSVIGMCTTLRGEGLKSG